MITAQGLLVPDPLAQSTNVKVVRYDETTGRILGVREAPLRDIEAEPYAYIEGDGHPNFHYVDIMVDPPAIKPRPFMPIIQTKKRIHANGRDGASFSGIPNPAVINLSGSEYEVTDGEFELSSEMPREFEIVISSWPYRDWKGKVIAIAGNV